MTENLSHYFEGVAPKRLSSHEVDLRVSNGHEFQGVNSLRAILGDISGDEKRSYRADFVYLGDDENSTFQDTGNVTWYDSRANQSHRSAEYRLYVPDNSVYEQARTDDLLVVAKRSDDSLLILIVKNGSTYEGQIRWLFNLPADLFRFSVQQVRDGKDKQIGFAERLIIEQLGIEVEQADEGWLDQLLAEFPNGFPTTAKFSAFARETLGEISVQDDPDAALMAWIDREVMLFKTLERHLVNKRLETSFTNVDDFITYSLSVQNRRKSRAGLALENQLEYIFKSMNVNYTRGGETENKSKPDFVFPGISEYHDNSFSSESLTMLGVKSTCKDRWRQVLSEASRISKKHLFTLEPSISENQTSEMKAKSLQLVLPESLHDTFRPAQQEWLINLNRFITVVRTRQN